MKKKRILRGSKYRLSDCHLHGTNFIQESDSFKNLIRQMDKANIEKAIVFGLPVKKIFTESERTPPEYYLDNDSRCYYFYETDDIIAEEYSKLNQSEQQRIIPFLCGFNPMDRSSVNIIERKFNRYKGVFKGVGECFLRHDDLTALTLGERPRCNSMAMHLIADFCAKNDLPLLLHQNVTSVGFDTHPEFLGEIKELLSHHPNTTVIWAHCGISRNVRIPNYNRLVINMLENFPNLFVDYSWVVYDEILDDKKEPKKRWLELTENFADRILLGSDLILDFALLGPTMRRYDVLLDKLTPEAREKICTGNLERLLKLN